MDQRMYGRRAWLTAMGALAASLGAPARATTFPSRPITLVVPYPAGGSADIAGRVVAKGLAGRLGQAVVVENKAGAGTVIAAAAVASAAADGHTLLFTSNTTYTIAPALRSPLPYDPLASFEPIGIVGRLSMVVLAHPSLGVETLGQLVALARRQPGKLSYASFGNATVAHLAGEMLKWRTGIDIVHVPYKGSAPAMQDLLGGQVPLSVDGVIAAKPHIEAGRVRALAVASAQRSPALPTVPTVAEAGYPGVELDSWVTVLAPRGLPPPVRERLVDALAQALKDPAVAAELWRAGAEAGYAPPEGYAERVLRESALIRQLVREAGITAD
ncbi:MAG: tripartite tricarboxylate transporter substrate binding protein [Burkholderiales bacterium]|nr:tripartite tricarboxylate transporter substrate binding protein [Burkholderiales bacterium]